MLYIAWEIIEGILAFIGLLAVIVCLLPEGCWLDRDDYGERPR